MMDLPPSHLLGLCLLLLGGCSDPVVVEPYLAVIHIAPPHGTTNVSVDTQVIATFSAALDDSTVTDGSVWLEDVETGTPVESTVQYYDGTWSIVVAPLAPLAPGTDWVLTLTQGLSSFTAGPLLAPIQSTFTTADTSTVQDQIPVAEAGPDQSVAVGELVVLDGSASHDPEGAVLLFTWDMPSLPEGSLATLDDPEAPSPTFLPDLPGEYVIRLQVSDGTWASDPDYVTVIAE